MDGFGGMFGAGIFGDVVFADLDGLSRVPRAAGRVGGSGFPADWNARLEANALEAERRRREQFDEDELVALMLAGAL